MKKLKIYVLLFSLFIFTACSGTPQKVYVKNIYITEANRQFDASVIFYDFDNETEEFVQKRYSSKDRVSLVAEIMDDNNYNFRLCENVFISEQLFRNNVGEIISVLNKLKIPPSSNILAYTGNVEKNEIQTTSLGENKLYNLSLSKKNVTGCFPVINDSGKTTSAVLIIDNENIEKIDVTDYTVLKILKGDRFAADYSFDGMWRLLDDISVYYSQNKKIFEITINMSLKEYKGENSSLQQRNLFIEALKKDLASRVDNIFKNRQIQTFANLNRYVKQTGYSYDDININVNIH